MRGFTVGIALFAVILFALVAPVSACDYGAGSFAFGYGGCGVPAAAFGYGGYGGAFAFAPPVPYYNQFATNSFYASNFNNFSHGFGSRAFVSSRAFVRPARVAVAVNVRAPRVVVAAPRVAVNVRVR